MVKQEMKVKQEEMEAKQEMEVKQEEVFAIRIKAEIAKHVLLISIQISKRKSLSLQNRQFQN